MQVQQAAPTQTPSFTPSAGGFKLPTESKAFVPKGKFALN